MDNNDQKMNQPEPKKEEGAQPQANQSNAQERSHERYGQDSRPQQRRPRPPRGPRPTEGASEFVEKVIRISRVTKVTKGGKKMSFSALVVVGDGKGTAGYYLGKANDVAVSIRKALIGAKKSMFKVHLKGSTIPHQVMGHWGAAKVLLKPASDGTGVIAAGPVRAICDAAGIRNILTKCHKSNNPLNVIKATVDGLMQLKVAKEAAVPAAPSDSKVLSETKE